MRQGSTQSNKPIIAVLLGDYTGIGPEITARILAEGKAREVAHLVVVGDARVLQQGMQDAGVTFATEPVGAIADIDWTEPAIPIIDLENIDPQKLPRGEVSTESGRLTGQTLAFAVEMADFVDALVCST